MTTNIESDTSVDLLPNGLASEPATALVDLIMARLDYRLRVLDVPFPNDPDVKSVIASACMNVLKDLTANLRLAVEDKTEDHRIDSFGAGSGQYLSCRVTTKPVIMPAPTLAMGIFPHVMEDLMFSPWQIVRDRICKDLDEQGLDRFYALASDLGFADVDNLVEVVANNPILSNTETIQLCATLERPNHLRPFTIHDMDVILSVYGNARVHALNNVQYCYTLDEAGKKLVPGYSRTTTATELLYHILHREHDKATEGAPNPRAEVLLQCFQIDQVPADQVSIEGAIKIKVRQDQEHETLRRREESFNDPEGLWRHVHNYEHYEKWIEQRRERSMP